MYLSVRQSVRLTVGLAIGHSVFYWSVRLSIGQSVRLRIDQSIYQSIGLSGLICPNRQSVRLPVGSLVGRSVYPSVHLSIYYFIRLFVRLTGSSTHISVSSMTVRPASSTQGLVSFHRYVHPSFYKFIHLLIP